MSVAIMQCPKRPFKSFAHAYAETDRFTRNTGHKTAPYRCETCGFFHTRSARKQLDETDLLILAHVARGLRDSEIAEDLGLSAGAITRRICRMMERTQTISRVHLCMYAVHRGDLQIDAIGEPRNG